MSVRFAKIVFIAAGLWGIVVLEKFGYALTVAVLYARGSISLGADAATAAPDLLLGILFVAAFARTPRIVQIQTH